jgi:DNA-binding YbaB/EbfC family protein
MTDSSGGVDLGMLAQRARQMRSQLEQARGDLSRMEGKGFGGNGLVQATVSGENILVDLAIDTSVINPDDPETLSDLVREAVNDAIVKLAARRGTRLSSITGGLGGLLDGAQARAPRVTPLTPSRRQDKKD